MDATRPNQKIVSFLSHLACLPLVASEPWALLGALRCLYDQLTERGELARLASLAGWTRQNIDSGQEDARTLLLLYQACAMWHSGQYHRREVRAKLNLATAEIATLLQSEWRLTLCDLCEELDEEVGFEVRPLSPTAKNMVARLRQKWYPTQVSA